MTDEIRSLSPFEDSVNLEHQPHEVDDGSVRSLETSRELDDVPELRVIRDYEVVASAPRSSDIGEVKLDYYERRVQERWLKNAFPEATLGNPGLSDLLKEESSDLMLSGDLQSYKPHAVAGEITALTETKNHSAAVPVLAMTTGEAGQILRLLRLTNSPWALDPQGDVMLHMWNFKPADQEDESYWCRDATPIIHLKFAHHAGRTGSLRWVIVQKETSTTILSPTYHSVPVAYENAALEELPASRVDPNPIITFTLAHTNGRSHSDVAFNPPTSTMLPQIALIDDSGYWSIWNIKTSPVSSRLGAQATLFKRGAPSWDTFPLQRSFGVLWYHPPPMEEWDFSQQSPSKPADDIGIDGAVSVTRSKTLLMWNRTSIQLLDTETGFIFSKLPITAPSPNQENILGVVPNPADASQVFVLTTFSLLYLDVCPSGEIAREVPPAITQSLLHNNAGDHTLQISATCMSSLSEDGKSVVLIFPRKGAQVDVFWFHGTPDGLGPEQASHQLQNLYGEEDADLDDLRTLTILPLTTSKGKHPIGLEIETIFDDTKVQFHQIISFGRRQSLGYWVCLTTKRGLGEISPTITRGEEWSKIQEDWKATKRAKYLAYMGDKFAVPDALTNPEVFVQRNTELVGGILEFEPLPAIARKAIIKRVIRTDLLLDAYCSGIWKYGQELRLQSLVAVRHIIRTASDTGYIATKSVLEYTNELWDLRESELARPADDPDYLKDDAEWVEELEQLIGAGIGMLILTDNHPHPPWQPGDDIKEKLSAMKSRMIEQWPIPQGDELHEAAKVRREILEHTARLELLSCHLIGMDEAYKHPQATASTPQSSAIILPSSSQDLPSEWSRPIFSQDTHISGFPSPSQAGRSNTKSDAQAEESRAAIRRLASLAAGIDQDAEHAKKPQNPILSRWEEAGYDDYIPFIQMGMAERQSQLQKKKEKVVERRRMKEATYSRLVGRLDTQVPASSQPLTQHLLHPQTQEPVSSQLMPSFSQAQIPIRPREGAPPSSQAVGEGMGLTMSQPVSGAFGQRRPAKKKKKKGGIK
ncbi:hypothetical protein jhhlp_001450 [Lomentospora prolificans]|uniref:RNA polymerase I-specific transcription initiation factor RRN6-like protein n=1 Tax=Lomentospora prolificans TaxID=41688 RepID=A0A2N3NIH1_9PEZI|nr:hypothetical protein jhhlp_001450 [Lomentospora prolificans]